MVAAMQNMTQQCKWRSVCHAESHKDESRAGDVVAVGQAYYLITGHIGQEELHQVGLDVLQGPGRFQGRQLA